MTDIVSSILTRVSDSTSTNVLTINSNGAASVAGTMTLAGGSQISIVNGTNTLTLDTNGAIKVASVGGTVTVVGTVTVTNTVPVSGTVSLSAGTTVTVTATNLSIRPLAVGTDSVSIGQGTNTLVVGTNGSINVNTTPSLSGLVCAYGASTNDIAYGTSFTFDYVVTTGKTFLGNCVTVGSAGTVKIQVGTVAGTNFTPLMTAFQQPSFTTPLEIETLTAAGGSKVRVIATNLDKATTLYCTIGGQEI